MLLRIDHQSKGAVLGHPVEQPARGERRPERIVHVVGRVTDEVYSFLGPATAAIARTGVDQSIVMIDDARFRHHAARLTGSAYLVLTPKISNPFKQWLAVLRSCKSQLTGGSLRAVHLHGLLPFIVCGTTARAIGGAAAIFFSPHASRVLGFIPLVGAMAVRLVRIAWGGARSEVIVNVPRETRSFPGLSATIIESPASNIFFVATRDEAAYPLVMAGGLDENAQSAALVAQFAVLLSGQDMNITFNWLGSVDAAMRVRLSAAKVDVVDVKDDHDCSQRLSRGWVYLAARATRGFPVFLIDAMAASLPCVVLDCPQYRELITHGETGFLCESERDMIEHIAMLIDDPSLRVRIGNAAREVANGRFRESMFAANLLSVYSHDA